MSRNRFSTSTAPLVGGLELSFGVLPEGLEAALLPAGADGIVGTELLEHCAVGFSMPDSLMILKARTGAGS